MIIYVLDHDDECECGYDDDGNIVYYCNKVGICPNNINND
jgi:hypothetical protein